MFLGPNFGRNVPILDSTQNPKHSKTKQLRTDYMNTKHVW